MKKESKYIVLKEDAQVTFSNNYSRWDDAFFLFTNSGDKIKVEIRAHRKNVSVIYFPPEPYEWLNPTEKNYTYDEYMRLLK